MTFRSKTNIEALRQMNTNKSSLANIAQGGGGGIGGLGWGMYSSQGNDLLANLIWKKIHALLE